MLSKLTMEFSCIVPAYNESGRIGNVLRVLFECPDLLEIIVIDDGSSDGTWGRLSTMEHPKLQKIRLEKNGGKTKAIFTGIRASR